MNKRIIIPALLVVTGILTLGPVKQVVAQENTSWHQSLVNRMVQRFGLKEADVKAVFDAQRQEHQDQMTARMEEKLGQLVKDGKITEAQKNKILAKHRELQDKKINKPNNWFEMSREEKRSLMESQRLELEKWAKDNGIDSQYLFGLGPGMGKGGHFGGCGRY